MPLHYTKINGLFAAKVAVPEDRPLFTGVFFLSVPARVVDTSTYSINTLAKFSYHVTQLPGALMKHCIDRPIGTLDLCTSDVRGISAMTGEGFAVHTRR